MASMQVPRTHP